MSSVAKRPSIELGESALGARMCTLQCARTCNIVEGTRCVCVPDQTEHLHCNCDCSTPSNVLALSALHTTDHERLTSLLIWATDFPHCINLLSFTFK